MGATIPVEHFGALIKASVEVTTQPDLRAVLETTVRVVRESTGARYVALGVVGGQGTLTEFVHTGVDSATAAHIGEYPVGKGILGTIIRDPVPLRLDSIAAHPDAAGFPEGHPMMMTFLGVPVRVGNAVFGNLYLADKEGGFSEQDEVLVVALAAIAGGAVAGLRLHQQLAHTAVLEDRERIARDIHDAVIQDLIAVGMNVQMFAAGMPDDASRRSLGEVVDRIEDGVDSLRSSILGLRGTRYADRERALDGIVAGFRRLAPVTLQIEPGVLEPLAPDVFEDVTHIVREATSNAVRHASAAAIEVDIRRVGDWVEVTVEDDGAGFDTSTPTSGMGLQTMRERAARVGGEMVVTSAPGAGTRVRVSIFA